MQIENRFQVAAPPDVVYAFLLDATRVVTCMPGAELSEVVDSDTFKGKVKIRVGPITVAYDGTARIVDKDQTARRAVLRASVKETTGAGSAEASVAMSVVPDGEGAAVTFATDLTVAGRIANFGRGLMEDVMRRLVDQMADCIKSQLETSTDASAATESAQPVASGSESPGVATAASASADSSAPAKPVNALSLFFAVLSGKIARLFKR